MKFTGDSPYGPSGIVSTIKDHHITNGFYIFQKKRAGNIISFGMRHHIYTASLSKLVDYPTLHDWTHYVMTLIPQKDASEVVSVFQNGVAAAVQKETHTKNNHKTTCSVIAFGQRYADQPGMGLSNNVVIDELLIFETILNEHEIMDIYEG